jgi:hypothetical protein
MHFILPKGIMEQKFPISGFSRPISEAQPSTISGFSRTISERSEQNYYFKLKLVVPICAPSK